MSDSLESVATESVRGSFFLIAGSLIATGILAVESIFVARFLGPDFYGQYALSIVLPQLLFLFTDFGISQGLIRYTASLRQRGRMGEAARIIRSGALFRFLAGFVLFSINYFSADFFAAILLNRPDIGIYIRIASFSVLFQVLFSIANSVYVGLDRAEYSAFITNIQATCKSIVSIALVLAGFGVIGAVVGHVVGLAISGIAGAILVFLAIRRSVNEGSDDRVEFTENLRILISYGTPLYISILLVGFILPYQNLVLGILTSDADIGNFKAAVNFIQLITAVSIPITTALLPAFAKLDSSSKEHVRNLFQFANKYTTILMVPFVVLVMIFSAEIVQIVYESRYGTAGAFLSVYCLVYLLVGIGSLNLPSLFNGLGKTKTTLMQNLITFAIVLFLTPYLTSVFSVLGLISVLIVATAAGAVYGVYVARNDFNIALDMKSLTKIYLVAGLSSIPSLLFVHASPLPLLLSVMGGGFLYIFLYLTLIPLAGIVNEAELRILSRISRRVKLLGPLISILVRYEERIVQAKFRVI